VTSGALTCDRVALSKNLATAWEPTYPVTWPLSTYHIPFPVVARICEDPGERVIPAQTGVCPASKALGVGQTGLFRRIRLGAIGIGRAAKAGTAKSPRWKFWR
jgi:hypothetical protein